MLNTIFSNPWDIFNDVDEEMQLELEFADLLVEISCQFIKYRLNNNLTQKDVADKLNISQAMVSKIESGDYNPTLDFLFKVAKKLNIDFNLTFKDRNSVDNIKFHPNNITCDSNSSKKTNNLEVEAA